MGEQTHPVDGLPSGIPIRAKMVRYEGCHQSVPLAVVLGHCSVHGTPLVHKSTALGVYYL